MKPNQQRLFSARSASTSVDQVHHRTHVSKRRSASICAIALGLLAAGFHRMQRAEAGGMGPLLLQTGGKVTALRPDEKSAVTFSADASQNAIASFDGKFVATTRPGPNETTLLEVRDPWNGMTKWTESIPGKVRVEAVSRDGRGVVLGDADISPSASSVPKGRTETRLFLAGEGARQRMLTLPGNFVAEAFLTNGTGVALIEHLPPSDPKSYRVRPLGFYGDKQQLLRHPIGGSKVGLRELLGAEEMKGVRLNQTWNKSGDALYTLYDSTNYPKGEGVFVHALDLATGLARCLDVPADIDAGEGKGKVVYTGTDKLIVVGQKGMVRMNSQTGAIEQKLRVQSKTVGALFARADKVYVSDGSTLREYQTSTLRQLSSTKFSSPLVAGTVAGQVPPIVVDTKGSIWYAIAKPVLRGTYQGTISKDAELLAQPLIG